MTEKKKPEVKSSIRNIKVYGVGNLWNPEAEEIFVKFRDGEALVNKDEYEIIKKYHPQATLKGQKKEEIKAPSAPHNVKAKSFSDVNVSFKIPDK